MIGRNGERGSRISALAARHDDDDDIYIYIYIYKFYGGVRGVMVFVVGNGHGDSSSNPGRD